MKHLQNGSDIRGVAIEGVADEPVSLTPQIVSSIAAAFAAWLEETTGTPKSSQSIAIGTDSRLSGPSLKAAAAQGLLSQGCTVFDCGLSSTPAMFMATIDPSLKCNGAIILTASHLPFNRNGMKFFTARGGLEKGDITKILDMSGSTTVLALPETRSPKQFDFMSVYSRILADLIRQEVADPINYNEPLKGFHIVVDAGNGSGGFFVDQVLAPLGANTTGSQFLNPDGRFPNHVPNPENEEAMESICAAVIEHHADLGIIFDTDVDRAAVVDRYGTEINRNRLVALAAAIVLNEHPATTIVTDSITSDGLTNFIEQKLGGRHHRFKRGYKNVINEAIRLDNNDQQCWLAIETSGHAAMKENYFLDDGAYLVAKILIKLALLRRNGQSIEKLIADLPEPAESQEFRLKINNPDFKAYGQKVIDDLKTFAQTQTGWTIVPKNYEGIRISCDKSCGDGWLLLRLSLHDPVIPLNVESNSLDGVKVISQKLLTFCQQYDCLDVESLRSYLIR